MKRKSLTNQANNFNIVTEGNKNYFVDEDNNRFKLNDDANLKNSLISFLTEKYSEPQTNLIVSTLERKEII
jgi:hypothetical protein